MHGGTPRQRLSEGHTDIEGYTTAYRRDTQLPDCPSVLNLVVIILCSSPISLEWWLEEAGELVLYHSAPVASSQWSIETELIFTQGHECGVLMNIN